MNNFFHLGSATVPVAASGVSPDAPIPPDVFGGTPKTAVETTALPIAP